MRAYKVKLKLNNKQKSICYQYARASHFAYNWCLEKQETNYRNGGKYVKYNQMSIQFTQFKKENVWLYGIQNYILHRAIKRCCDAYIRFFKKCSNKPKYKSKKKK